MSPSRIVRTCPTCTQNNDASAALCEICSDDLTTVPLRRVTLPSPRLLGTAERTILGCGVGVLFGLLLQPHDPVMAIVTGMLASTNDGLHDLTMPLRHQSVTLVALCGAITGCVAALASVLNGSGLRAMLLTPIRRWPCPSCAEMIRSEASVCRHCGRRVAPEATGYVAFAGRG